MNHGTSSELGGDVAWEHVLAAAAQGQHIAQLYTEPGFLARAVSRFATAGRRRGEGILLIVTDAHRSAIGRQLEGEGFALDELSRRGQVALLDATLTLAALSVHGLPERERFQAVIGGAIEAVKAAGYPRLRAFGDMVDILRRASFAAALHLEELWTELVRARGIALLCGYDIDILSRQTYHGLIQGISTVHSHVVPVEDYARLKHAVDSAFVEIFGAGRDAWFLRQTFLAHYPKSAAMPDAQAAILAVQEFVPDVAAALLERVRRHYHGSATAA